MKHLRDILQREFGALQSESCLTSVSAELRIVSFKSFVISRQLLTSIFYRRNSLSLVLLELFCTLVTFYLSLATHDLFRGHSLIPITTADETNSFPQVIVISRNRMQNTFAILEPLFTHTSCCFIRFLDKIFT